MKPSLLIHASDPRLGRGPGERVGDRVRALARVVGEAVSAGASAVLAAGRLFEPGAEPTSTLGAIEGELNRLRTAGIPLLTTTEAGADPLLNYLSGRGLIVTLAAADGADLPTLELSPELRVVGLGRPRSRTAIAERVGAVPQRTRGGAQVLLLDASSPAFAPSLLEPARSRFTYAALGGLPFALSHKESVQDPGPLTRLSLSNTEEPGFLRVSLQAKRIEIERLSSEDRPLIVVSIDARRSTRAASPETQLREQLRAVDRRSRPCLSIEVRDDDHEPDTAKCELETLARKLIDPVMWTVRTNRGHQDDRSREDLERMVCEEHARNRAPGFTKMALSAFDLALEAGPGHIDRITALITEFIAATSPSAGGPR